MKRTISVAATIAALPLLLASSAGAQTPPSPPPGFPDFELPGKVERFQLTVRGTQLEDIAFKWNPTPGTPCPLYAEGTLREFREYARGKAVVMEFRTLAGRMIVQRANRGPGDGAFAAPGTVTRLATGFLQGPSANACPTFPFDQTDCAKAMPAKSDLALGYRKGRLTLKESGPAAGDPNPVEKCGSAVQPAVNFGGELSSSYPFLNVQSAALSRKQIFRSNRNIKLTLKAKFLEPADSTSGFTEFTGKLVGSTVVTLKRL